MAGNDDLHPLLESINETLAELRTDIKELTGEIKKIPELLEKGFKQVRDAIHENIQAQAELKMMEHMMEVSTVKPQIEAERDQIQQVREELDERLEQISDRYADKHTELDEKAAERVRTLGSHIFAIEEDEFEDGIEEPFTTQVTPVWRDFQAHNHMIHGDRQTEVVERTESVVDEIDAFLSRKQQLVTQIDDHLLDPDAVPRQMREQSEVQLPYYVVEYEVDGVSKQVVVPPSEIRHARNSDTWSAAALAPIDGAQNLASADRRLDRSTATRKPLDRQAVLAALDEHGTESRLGPSYVGAVEQAIPEGVEITIEGGAG